MNGTDDRGHDGAAGLHFEHVGLGTALVDYGRAWDLQRNLHAQVAAGTAPATVLLLEHPPVYTAGKRTQPHERPFDGTPVIDVDRGGKITWHGPGQLVGYPIVRLADPVDVVAYVRRLEVALIGVCADLGLAADRVAGRSGVWLAADGHRPARKVAAIGIRVSQGVTMHGFALNCNPDLSWFTRIVPCGIPDAGVTSLSVELGRKVTVADVVPLVERHLNAVGLDGSPGTATSRRTRTSGATTSGTSGTAAPGTATPEAGTPPEAVTRSARAGATGQASFGSTSAAINSR